MNQLDGYPYPAELERVLSTIMFLVNRIDVTGYIRREADAKDLRKYQLTLTAKGRKMMERGRKTFNNAFRRRLEKLKDGEVETFRCLLSTLS